MKIKQINLRKSFAATNLFAATLHTESIGLLTEPYHYRNKICKLGYSFDLFPENTLDAPPRAAILIPKSFHAVFLPHLSRPDVSTVFLKHANLLLVSGYFDAKLPVIQDWMTNIMQYVQDKSCKLILGIDSNCHSELFGKETDKRGELLEDFIFLNDLVVENRGNIPTFSTLKNNKLASSFIDVTLSKDVDVVDWRVDESFNNSDHNTLCYELLLDPPPVKLIRPWSKANWTRFNRILASHTFAVPEIMSIKKLDKLVQSMYKTINYALDKSCPKRPAKASSESIKWWDKKLNNAAKSLNKQYKKAKRARSSTETSKLKDMSKAFKKKCKRAKRTAWRQFTFNISKTDKMASLAKTLQKKERRKLYTLRKNDGTMTEPGTETLNLLFHTHFPASTPLKKVSYSSARFAEVQSQSKDIKNKYSNWINLPLLNKAMKKFNKKKSPGPDGLKPIVFDHLPLNFKEHILFIYKCCIHFHYTPVKWKDTKVIFIPKPGKDDYSLPKSFRPISLSNYFLKCLERLAGWKMDDALVNQPIHKRQHGFTKGRSTESAISVTTNYIEKYLALDQHCLAIFLDISAAFDSIDINHVRKSLLDHWGHPDMVDWYHNYLSHRNLYADLHQEDASCSTGVGFPQGGVCSARFWLIAFNKAIKIINNTFVEGTGYADDCCILIGGTNQSHMVAQVQRTLNKLIQWGNSCGLHFNHSKTVAVLFTRTNKKFRRHIRIDGNDIPYSPQVKYLGLILDSKLTWRSHISEKAIACKRFLFMVARITKDAYGPSPKIMRWAYLGVVRPMITYGALCWAHVAHTDAIDKILRNLNRAGMNTYSNFPRSSPTRTVEIITDTMPLSLHAQKVGISSRIRLKEIINLDWEVTSTDHHNTGSHIKYWDNLISDCNLEEFLNDDDSIQTDLPFTNYTIQTDSFSGSKNFLSQSQYNVYTDGSKLNDRVGAGVFISKHKKVILEESYRLPNKATVFQAEIYAINKAALYLQSINCPQYVKFFVDSQAALLALNNKSVSSRLVGDTIHNLNLIQGRVRLVWIKAHVGHPGNEKADELAKDGTKLGTIQHIALPKQATKFAIKFAFDEIWKYQWSIYNDGRQSKQFYPSINRNKAKYSYNLSRQELGRLIRITTGHNNLFYHRSNVDRSRSTSPLCRFCQDSNETFYHFATSCPAFRLSRLHYFQNDSCFTNGRWSIRQILDFSNIPSIAAALGGTFDPMEHLEIQRDFEDIIEAEQVDANLQTDRHSTTSHLRHNLSTSDSSDNDNRLPAVVHYNDLDNPDDPDERMSEGIDDSVIIGGSSDCSDGNPDPRTRPNKDDRSSILEGPDLTNYNTRDSINYATFELTDEEYLQNESNSELESD